MYRSSNQTIRNIKTNIEKLVMQNLNNIKSLNENQIDPELEQIVKYFQNNNFPLPYIFKFQVCCKKFLLNGNNKTVNMENVTKEEKAILIEFESYLNIKYMNRS